MTCFAARTGAQNAILGSEWAAIGAKTQAGYAIVRWLCRRRKSRKGGGWFV